jgi:succinate dehydrogenase flavin-adding protein (antitoxin of CptAB toxin-antitoxin module)
MSPSTLRHLWHLIEKTQGSILLSMDDKGLVQWLISQFQQEQALDPQETNYIQNYLNSRLLLIRDLAQERMATQVI